MLGSVAVIIPTLNSPTLGAVVAEVRAQMTDRDACELLVVGRDDEKMAERGGARHIAADQTLNPAASRNVGIRSTTADYLIFLDSDCIPGPGWLGAMLCHRMDERVIVGGAMRIVPDRYLRLAGNISTFHEFTAALASSDRPYLPTFSLGVPRQAIARFGGFDERLTRAEDLDFTIRMRRAGYRLRFDACATVVHWPQWISVGGLIDHSIRSGRCSIRVRRHYPDAFRMPRFLLQWPVLLACAPLIAAGVAVRAWTRNRDVRKFWPVLPIVFLTRYLWIIGACQTLRQNSVDGPMSARQD
jgi:glycosyltransferase involved in cell wall biosynthesis